MTSGLYELWLIKALRWERCRVSVVLVYSRGVDCRLYDWVSRRWVRWRVCLYLIPYRIALVVILNWCGAWLVMTMAIWILVLLLWRVVYSSLVQVGLLFLGWVIVLGLRVLWGIVCWFWPEWWGSNWIIRFRIESVSNQQSLVLLAQCAGLERT